VHSLSGSSAAMLSINRTVLNYRNTNIGRKVAVPTGNNAQQFQGQKIKGQGRPTNADCENASYLPNWKAYELQNWYADEACAINWHCEL